jgi:acetamidase/formamidase
MLAARSSPTTGTTPVLSALPPAPEYPAHRPLYRIFQLILHKQNSLSGSLAGLNYPLLETQDEWVLHGFSFANYLVELGPTAQQEIYKKSSIDLALRDAFRKMRSFLMTTKGLTEDEAISLMSIEVDFGVTQVVDGNWGIHAIIKKNLFAGITTA